MLPISTISPESDTGLSYYDKVQQELTHDERVQIQKQLLGANNLKGPQAAFWFRFIVFAQLWVPGTSLRGNQAVTKDTIRTANQSSVLLSFSSLIDYVSSLGLFSFIFAGAPGVPLLYSFLISTAFLGFGNYSGRGMTNRLPGAKSSANASLTLFLVLSVIQSLTAGLGVFLFSGSERVVEAKAREITSELIRVKQDEVENYDDPSHPMIASYKDECDSLRLDIKNATNQRERDRLIVLADGTWADQRMNPPGWIQRSSPRVTWPACYRYQTKKDELTLLKDNSFKALTDLRSDIKQYPTHLGYLQDRQPRLFNDNFKLIDGAPLLKSNAEAFGAAWNYFWNPPAGPNPDLTISYVYMWLSVLTSTGAIGVLMMHSNKKHTLMSYSTECGNKRDAMHRTYKLKANDEITVPGSIDEGYTPQDYFDGSLPIYKRRLKQVLQQGNFQARLEAKKQEASSSFDFLDLSSDHRGVILSQDIANKCEQLLEEEIDAAANTIASDDT